MGRNARRFADRYDWDRVGQAFIELYRGRESVRGTDFNATFSAEVLRDPARFDALITEVAAEDRAATELVLRKERRGNASTLLDDGTLKTVRRVVVAGGFSSLGMAASSALAIYNEFALTVSPLSVGGTPRTLRQARGGLTAIGVGDGTVLLSGGRVNAGGTDYAPASTGEIFADPQDPPEPEN